MEIVLGLIEDARLLAAKKEYDKIMQSPEKCIEHAGTMNSHKDQIDKMLERCEEVDRSMKLVSSKNEDWVLATDYLGVTTHYMLGDDGYLWVRMESTQADVPVMEQLSVVYEVELFKTWVPFCTDSRLILRLSHTELIAYACIGTPFGLSREGVVHAFGVDCIYETGSLVVVGESIDEFEGVELPQCKGMFNKRANVKFSAVVTPYSPTSGHMIVVAKVDPKLALPQSIVNFVTKQLAGFFLVMVYQQAREIANKEDSIYRTMILENKAFYVDWVLPRIRALFDHRGWEQPVIACLGDLGVPDGNASMASRMESNSTKKVSGSIKESRIEDASASSMNIEGILHKKGNALFYTAWSLRYFELDVKKQKLQWYRCKPGGKKGVMRGEINLAKASACLKTAKQSTSNQKGHLISLTYTPVNSSTTAKMTLLCSTLDEAYQWIAHTNKAGSFYDVEKAGISTESVHSDADTFQASSYAPLMEQDDVKSQHVKTTAATVDIDNILNDDYHVHSIGSLTSQSVNSNVLESGMGRIVFDICGGIFDFMMLSTPLLPLWLPPQHQRPVYIASMYILMLVIYLC